MLAEKHNPESLTVRHERARKGRGVFLRPLGNTVYVLPPYCVTPADLDAVWGAIASFAD